jgi:hypothetical protein
MEIALILNLQESDEGKRKHLRPELLQTLAQLFGLLMGARDHDAPPFERS